MSPLDGRFELLERLPDQGYGESWKARDLQVRNRVVVVKLLRPAGAADASLDATLGRLKGFRHGAVLALLHHGVAEGRPYVAHDFFDGPSLATGLAQGWREGAPMPRAVIERVAEKLCAGVDAAHALSPPLVHGGLGAGCVLLKRASPQHFDLRVVDFGVAPYADPPADPSRAGALATTARDRADVAADVAGLGRVLRALLASPAAPGQDPPTPGRDWRRDDVPDEAWAVVERATAQRPDARFADVGSLRRALDSAWGCPVKGPAPRPPASAAAPVAAAPVADEAPAADEATVVTPRAPVAQPPAAPVLESRTVTMEAAWSAETPAAPVDDATVFTFRRRDDERTAEWGAAEFAKAAQNPVIERTEVAPRAPAAENPWATEVRLREVPVPTAARAPAGERASSRGAWIAGVVVALLVALAAAFAAAR